MNHSCPCFIKYFVKRENKRKNTEQNTPAWLNLVETCIKSPKSMRANVLWSDETKAEPFDYNFPKYVWCENSAHHQKNTMFTVELCYRSIKFWPLISLCGRVGINSIKYQSLFGTTPSGLIKRTCCIFQHDDDPKALNQQISLQETY